jgi:hypothetical protein
MAVYQLRPAVTFQVDFVIKGKFRFQKILADYM